MNFPFHADVRCDTTESKKELLKQFLVAEDIQYEDGIPVNRAKFLYLYGAHNTGKYTLLKEIAQEVFGSQWEQRMYIRLDEGQKFPYKLHAHKVESSQKIVLVTDKQDYWLKWKDLYPASKTFHFEGAEITPTPQGHVTIDWPVFMSHHMPRLTTFQTTTKQTVQTFFIRHSLPAELANELVSQITTETKNYGRDLFNILTSSEISHVNP